MKYIYPFTKLQNHKTLLDDINSAARRLHKKVEVLDGPSLPISHYNKHYFDSYQKDILRVLQRSSFILFLSTSVYRKPLSDLVFVDYGGGTGFLALLAKELGIGTVIYSDIYDISCQDARVIADSLQLVANSYVCGDVDELLDFLHRERIHCDAIMSYDVLEHIYNVESFLHKLVTSPNGPSTILMASAANKRNPFIRKNLGKMHFRYEYEDRSKEPWHKERDTLKAFHSVRKEIIENYAPELSQKEVEVLAKNTRGKIIGDILECVEEYKKEKSLSVKPKHLTNTCDPYTGNWQEQLLELDWLEGILKREGIITRILPGYYGTHAHPIKNLIGLGLNLFISKFPDVGLGVAPFYIFCGVRDIRMQETNRGGRACRG
jgi:2-polyprenyl-3-methyl-5-hydroxy-6-metoxy-1,4-benzoquinol methylase